MTIVNITDGRAGKSQRGSVSHRGPMRVDRNSLVISGLRENSESFQGRGAGLKKGSTVRNLKIVL